MQSSGSYIFVSMTCTTVSRCFWKQHHITNISNIRITRLQHRNDCKSLLELVQVIYLHRLT